MGPKVVGVDITVIFPHNAYCTNVAALFPGTAAGKAEALKATKYGEFSDATDVEFVPLGIDIYAAPGPPTKAFLRKAPRLGTNQSINVMGWVYPRTP